MVVNGCCKLCLQEKKLVKAHIIPEHFYSGLYNEKGQYVEFHISKDKSKEPKSDSRAFGIIQSFAGAMIIQFLANWMIMPPKCFGGTGTRN
jgi:hypothetical protein